MSLRLWLKTRLSSDALPVPEELTLVEKPKSADELMFDALDRLRTDLELVANLQHKLHEDGLRGTTDAIKSASNWVKRAGIAFPLLAVVEETKHWHSWLKLPRYVDHLPLGLIDIVTSHEMGTDRQLDEISFGLLEGGSRYLILHEAHGLSPHQISYFADGEHVLTLEARMETERYPDDPYVSSWSRLVYDGVVSHLVPGAWAASIVELNARISMAAQAKRDGAEALKAHDLARGLPK